LTDSGAWSGRYAPVTAEIKEKAIVRGLLWCLEPRGIVSLNVGFASRIDARLSDLPVSENPRREIQLAQEVGLFAKT